MSIKLLLADDSITIQKVIGIIFGGEEYSLTVVDNGKSAVDKARELCPDVLLIDALMPGMNGYEVCEAVRATPELAVKPILILTGSFEPFDEDKARKCGADDFLAKPFESQNIINKVKELAELGASRASGAAAQPAAAAPEAPVAVVAAPEPAPAAVQQPAAPAAADTAPAPEPADIWGAFTPDAEPSPAPALSPETPADVSADLFEPDVFAIVSEETDSQPAAPVVPAASAQHTGTQWVPVEEHTFEFEDEKVVDMPQTAFSDQAPPAQEADFGDIAFEEAAPAEPAATPVTSAPAPDFIIPEPALDVFEPPAPPAEPAIPAFEPPPPAPEPPAFAFDEPPSIPAVEPVPPVAPAPPVVAAAPPVAAPAAAEVPLDAPLSEAQLRAALSAASREVIERIVWEVVPDLAETMIREAIRKIKEGV